MRNRAGNFIFTTALLVCVLIDIAFFFLSAGYSAKEKMKVAKGRALDTLAVELSTWLSCSLHFSFVAQTLWHGCGVYIVDQRCEILTNKFESSAFCWL